MPAILPQPPGRWFGVAQQLDISPLLAAVGADFNFRNGPFARPGGPVDPVFMAGRYGLELTRPCYLRLDLHLGDRTQDWQAVVTLEDRIVHGLVITIEGALEHHDAL